MTFLFYFAIFLFITLSAVLCLVILVQESKSMGLGASFGGDPGESVFGASTAEVLKKFTAYLAAAFMIACVFLSLWSGALSKNKASSIPTTIEQTESSK